MIVIAGSIPLDPAAADRIEAAAITMQEATRAEPGCHAYRFSRSIDTPGSM